MRKNNAFGNIIHCTYLVFLLSNGTQSTIVARIKAERSFVGKVHMASIQYQSTFQVGTSFYIGLRSVRRAGMYGVRQGS